VAPHVGIAAWIVSLASKYRTSTAASPCAASAPVTCGMYDCRHSSPTRHAGAAAPDCARRRAERKPPAAPFGRRSRWSACDRCESCRAAKAAKQLDNPQPDSRDEQAGDGEERSAEQPRRRNRIGAQDHPLNPDEKEQLEAAEPPAVPEKPGERRGPLLRAEPVVAPRAAATSPRKAR
jgi:hypothetical protein